MRRAYWILGVLLLFVVTACQTARYTYKGANFDSADRALAAQQIDNDELLSKITSTTNPVGGSATVVLPSASLIEKNGLTKRGNPRQEQVDFIVKSAQQNYSTMGAAITKRHIFDTTTIVQSDTPDSYTAPRGYVVYLSMPAPGAGQWFLKKTDQAGEPIPVYINNAKQGPERILSWLDNIEKAARQK